MKAGLSVISGLIIIIALFASQPSSIRAQAGKTGAVGAASADRPQLVVQTGHSFWINAVAFSSDGRFILTGSEDGTARLWETGTGREIRTFKHGSLISSAAFSPDGQSVLIGGPGQDTRLWDVRTGQIIRSFKLEGYSGEAWAVAFSSDGRSVLTGAAGGVVTLWDASTGREIRRFQGHTDRVSSVAFSSDRRLIASASWDNTVRFWNAGTGQEIRRVQPGLRPTSVAFSPDARYVLTGVGNETAVKLDAATGREVRRFEGQVEHPEVGYSSVSAAFSPDGRFVLTTSLDWSVRLWDARTGEEIRRFKGSLGLVRCIAFSPDGQSILAGNYAPIARLFERATGDEIRRFEAQTSDVGPLAPLAISPDGRFILITTSRREITSDNNLVVTPDVQLWDVGAGQQAQRFEGCGSPVAFSPDGQFVVTGGKNNIIRLWDATTGIEIRRFEGHTSIINCVAISSDGRFILTGANDKTTRLWDATTGKEIRRFQSYASHPNGNTGNVTTVAFSPDGRSVIAASSGIPTTVETVGGGGTVVQVWDAATGKEVRRFYNLQTAAAFSPDSRLLLTGGTVSDPQLWDVTTGKEILRLKHYRSSTPAGFTPDGRFVLTIEENTGHLWETATGKEARRIEGLSGRVAFSPDGRYLLTNNVIRSVTTGQELCRLVSFRDSTWAVVDPEGRFDSNNLEEIRGLHWIMPDDPLRPLPLEIFMRDYYEPRLLPRILNGDQLNPVRSLSQLNRAQPDVKISDIRPQKDNPDLVTVTVEVSKPTGQFKQAARNVTQIGVFDVRLFRNGQIVGQSPRPDIASGISDDLLAWRQTSQVKLDPTGKQVIRFDNIRLPRRAGFNQVAFSAYAFNDDRVKSQTHSKLFDLPPGISPKKGRAYVITVGVNAYQDSSLNLRFAADDARLTQKVLSERLRLAAEYEEVISISLLSDYGPEGKLTEKSATKANFKTVLDVLAGKRPDARLLRDIPNADKLSKGSPDDLLLISIASHGDADAGGNFYLFPYDIGEGSGQKIRAELLSRCISSDELSAWLRDVDAGEMVLIVDACHSAASVEGQGFKPGPMGSRGLGQLAYDKGMRILAASQADDVAIESEQVRAGLLTYALIRDGIEGLLADGRPKDGKVMMDEWLGYGAERVPGLYEEVRRGEVKSSGRGQRAKIVLVKAGKSLKRAAQQPALFDFTKKKREVILVK